MTSLIDRLKGLNLYLIGMMGAGKTTIGQQLAAALSYQFFDTDSVVEQATGQSVSDLFATVGEPAFRQLETQALAELTTYRRLVVATGGGVVLNQSNWSYLQQGVIIWLDVPVATLFDRLKSDTPRPLLQTPDPMAKLQSILEARQPLYQQADLQIAITPEESPEAIASRILTDIPKVLKPDHSTADLN
jgi:shikimate kinase